MAVKGLFSVTHQAYDTSCVQFKSIIANMPEGLQVEKRGKIKKKNLHKHLVKLIKMILHFVCAV